MCLFSSKSEKRERIAQSERLIVVETHFEDFQRVVVDHIKYEKLEFSKVEKALKDIVNHINDAKRENRQDNAILKSEIFDLLEKDYSTKLELSKQLTVLKKETITEVEASKKRVFRELTLLFTAVSVVVIIAAWLYVNIIMPNQVERPRHPPHSVQKLTSRADYDRNFNRNTIHMLSQGL